MGALLVAVVWAPLAWWAGWQAVGHFGAVEWGFLLASAVLHILYFRTLLHGYAVSDLSVVYPVARGSGPLLSSAGAVLVLGESLSAIGLLGMLAVVAGVLLIAGGPSLWRQVHAAHDAQARQRVRLGLTWGALTGVFIAGYTVLDGYAVKVLLISPILLDYVGNVLRIPLMLPFALRDRAGFVLAWRQQWRAALVVAVLGPLGYVMVLYAILLAPLSHVAPAREVSMLFAAIAGGTLLGEGDKAWRIAGAATMAGGVVMLALG
jgi:drug/metabolite transporter (DMT)-like permease